MGNEMGWCHFLGAAIPSAAVFDCGSMPETQPELSDVSENGKTLGIPNTQPGKEYDPMILIYRYIYI